MRLLKLSLAIFLLLFLTTPTFAQDSVFDAGECPFDIPSGQTVECGYLTVPTVRSQPDGDTIRLAVAVFRSPNPDKEPDPIVYLEGGPGGDTLEAVSLIFGQRYAPYLENRDLILFDQRGTGYSEPSLACPELTEFGLEYLDDYLTPEESGRLGSDAVLDCGERLADEGVNLEAFDSAASAADLDDLRQALGYDEWNLWGVSYGTRLALTAMRDTPGGIRSVVLDSTYPLEANLYTSIAANAARAFDVLFAGCAADSACSAAYPTLEADFYTLVETLNVNPVTLAVRNPLSGQNYDALITGDGLVGFMFQSLYISDLIPVLPQLIAEADAGDYDGIAQLLGAFLANADYVSLGMQLSVQCREEVAFTSEDELVASMEAHPELRNFLVASPTLGPALYGICQEWGAGAADDIENQSVNSDVPTLVMAGEYDPITPPVWSQQVADTLDNAYYVELPGEGHGPSLQDACAAEVVMEFVNDPTRAPGAGCVDDMTTPAFAISSEQPAEITLGPFTSDTFGITGLVPDGWNEAAPGVYQRGGSALDSVALIQQAAPGTPANQLVALLTTQLGLDDAPEEVGRREANGLTWVLYELEVQGIQIDLAVTEDAVNSYLVLMQYPPDERESLYETVFLAAVDALQPA